MRADHRCTPLYVRSQLSPLLRADYPDPPDGSPNLSNSLLVYLRRQIHRAAACSTTRSQAEALTPSVNDNHRSCNELAGLVQRLGLYPHFEACKCCRRKFTVPLFAVPEAVPAAGSGAGAAAVGGGAPAAAAFAALRQLAARVVDDPAVALAVIKLRPDEGAPTPSEHQVRSPLTRSPTLFGRR